MKREDFERMSVAEFYDALYGPFRSKLNLSMHHDELLKIALHSLVHTAGQGSGYWLWLWAECLLSCGPRI